jgi:hypothetical protein
VNAVVRVGLLSLADGAGDAQPPLQLVAYVAEARVEKLAAGGRPAVGLACSACDVRRAVALCVDLLIGHAAAAVHARPVRVLVSGRGFVAAGVARLADTVSDRICAHVTDALHLPGATVCLQACRTRLAGQRTRVLCHSILRACAAVIQSQIYSIDLDFTQMKIFEWHVH